jgi:hypothetical protein
LRRQLWGRLIESSNLHRIRCLKDGSVRRDEVDLAALGASADLPYDIDRYFLPQADALLVELDRLIVTRARPSGIANAATLMDAAYHGRHPRREAISISPYGADAFLVEDGNSTVLNAIASGWPHILCVLAVRR